MIEISQEVITITDSSKFLKRSFASICPITGIDVLVTDDGIDSEQKLELEQAGITVLIAWSESLDFRLGTLDLRLWTWDSSTGYPRSTVPIGLQFPSLG